VLEVATENRVRVSRADCERCGTPLPAGPRRGLPRRWCSERCRHLARRAAQAATLGRLRAGLLLLRDQVDDRLAEVDALMAAKARRRRTS